MVLERLRRLLSGDRCACERAAAYQERDEETSMVLEDAETDVRYALRQLVVHGDVQRAIDALERVQAGLESLKDVE